MLAVRDSLPDWLQRVWPQVSFLSAKLKGQWDKSTELKLRGVVKAHFPEFSPELLQPNLDSDCLHMQFLRQSLATGDAKWLKRATQFGGRHASFPLMYSWDDLSTELRKYLIYTVVHFEPGAPGATLQLLPCSLVRFIDYLEWLPSAGLSAGWNTIRHYAGQLSTFSEVCGHGSIIGQDPVGYKVWQENFSANVHVSVAPRGGDKPLYPWHVRRLAQVYSSGSPYDKMWLATFSQLWFTALRVGHFSPRDDSADGMKHLVEWEHIVPCEEFSCGVPRPANHYFVDSAKNRQKEDGESWSTATCCICEGVEASEDELQALTALCPVCALERWRLVSPDSTYVCCNPDTGKPIKQGTFNKELRRALNKALDYIPQVDREAIIKQLSAKSFRSGAATAIVTAGNAGFVAAAFLGHSDPKITKKYYHKGGDSERLQVAPALAAGLMDPPGRAVGPAKSSPWNLREAGK